MRMGKEEKAITCTNLCSPILNTVYIPQRSEFYIKISFKGSRNYNICCLDRAEHGKSDDKLTKCLKDPYSCDRP
jgi:hypothetical protein